MIQGGQSYTYHYSNSGHTVAITDDQEAVVNQYAYSPFGRNIGETEASGFEQPFKYVGKYGVQHEQAEIYYMRARYYDAGAGRFLKEDPIGFQGGLNVSLYVGGNPVVGIDPSGLVDCNVNGVDACNLGFGLVGLVGSATAFMAGSVATIGGVLIASTGAGAPAGVVIAVTGAGAMVLGAHGVMSSLNQIDNAINGTNNPGPLESVAGQLGGSSAAQAGANADFAIGIVSLDINFTSSDSEGGAQFTGFTVSASTPLPGLSDGVSYTTTDSYFNSSSSQCPF